FDEAVGEPRGHAAQRQHLDCTISAGRRGCHANAPAERLLEFSERLDDQKIRREPYRSAPVAVTTLEPFDRLGGLVPNRCIAECKWMVAMRFAHAPDSERRQKLVRVDPAREQRFDLFLIDDRQDMRVVAVAMHGRDTAVDDLAPMVQEPVEILTEDTERLDPFFFEPLNSVERNE